MSDDEGCTYCGRRDGQQHEEGCVNYYGSKLADAEAKIVRWTEWEQSCIDLLKGAGIDVLDHTKTENLRLGIRTAVDRIAVLEEAIRREIDLCDYMRRSPNECPRCLRLKPLVKP